jgi:hypothetical protein
MENVGQKTATIYKNLTTIGEPISFEEIEDLAEDLVKAVWDCKDRIFKLANNNGIAKNVLWDEIKKHWELCVIADLANTIKHDGLNKPPISGIFPVINGIRNSAKGNGPSTIERDGETLIVKHSLCDFEIFASIRNLNDQSNEIGEVFYFCDTGISQWNNIMDHFGISP